MNAAQLGPRVKVPTRRRGWSRSRMPPGRRQRVHCGVLNGFADRGGMTRWLPCCGAVTGCTQARGSQTQTGGSGMGGCERASASVGLMHAPSKQVGPAAALPGIPRASSALAARARAFTAPASAGLTPSWLCNLLPASPPQPPPPSCSGTSAQPLSSHSPDIRGSQQRPSIPLPHRQPNAGPAPPMSAPEIMQQPKWCAGGSVARNAAPQPWYPAVASPALSSFCRSNAPKCSAGAHCRCCLPSLGHPEYSGVLWPAWEACLHPCRV